MTINVKARWCQAEARGSGQALGSPSAARRTARARCCRARGRARTWRRRGSRPRAAGEGGARRVRVLWWCAGVGVACVRTWPCARCTPSTRAHLEGQHAVLLEPPPRQRKRQAEGRPEPVRGAGLRERQVQAGLPSVCLGAPVPCHHSRQGTVITGCVVRLRAVRAPSPHLLAGLVARLLIHRCRLSSSLLSSTIRRGCGLQQPAVLLQARGRAARAGPRTQTACSAPWGGEVV